MIPRPRGLVFGSLHYDITVEGPGLPRKGETVAGYGWRPKCGGKGGNQAVAAARAGAQVSMVGATGEDDFGGTLRANLKKWGVDATGVRAVPGFGSGMSVAVFDAEGDYGAVIVSGANLTLTGDEVVPFLTPDTGFLILQNEIPDVANRAAARIARNAGVRVLLNAAPARPLTEVLREDIDVLVVNAIEAEQLGSGITVCDLPTALYSANQLLDHFKAVVVTAGGAGVAYADRAGQRFSIEALPIEVQSTHGAGDEFVGALAVALATGEPSYEALSIANRAAAKLVATAEVDR